MDDLGVPLFFGNTHVVSLYQIVFGTLLCFVDAIGDSKLYLATMTGYLASLETMQGKVKFSILSSNNIQHLLVLAKKRSTPTSPFFLLYSMQFVDPTHLRL